MELFKESLKDKIAVLSGIGPGQGRAVAELLLDQGAKVIAFSRSGRDVGIRNEGFHLIKGDSTSPGDVERILYFVKERYESVDLLYNNHGYFSVNESKILGSQMMEFFSENVMSSVNTINAFYPLMKKGGSIVNVGASRSLFRDSPLEYSVSKFSVEEMTVKFASLLKKFNIRVNAILPGSVDSPTSFQEKQAFRSKELKDKNVVTTTEVAYLALFLLSDLSYGLTGQCVSVDSGSDI